MPRNLRFHIIQTKISFYGAQKGALKGNIKALLSRLYMTGFKELNVVNF